MRGSFLDRCRTQLENCDFQVAPKGPSAKAPLWGAFFGGCIRWVKRRFAFLGSVALANKAIEIMLKKACIFWASVIEYVPWSMSV